MCSIMACAITPVDWGRRNVQASLPGGSAPGENDSCTVPDSAATSAIAIATGVAADPPMRSTWSSVTNRLALTTPLVGSVASSRMITLSFSPAIVCGHSAIMFFIGMPSPEAGPVSGRLMPMVTSACAQASAHASSEPATALRKLR